MNNSIYFITGPTCIGKSSLAINLSRQINGEIINADSMQIYKELQILTARPKSTDVRKIKHHLYGYINGYERFNVEKWCTDASKIINTLQDNNITPIFVGGTGLYIDKLINGITLIPSIPESAKDESKKIFEKIGKDEFYKLVNKLDHEAVEKISKNDIQRLKRIWEVNNYTKNNFSYWKKFSNKKFLTSLDLKIILFLPDRKKNYKRVNERVYSMINDGAIEEVKKLISLKYKKSLPIMKAHGVPEIISYLQNHISLDECIEKIQLVTRHYVKRQNTWWKSTKLPILKEINDFPDEIDLKSTNLDYF